MTTQPITRSRERWARRDIDSRVKYGLVATLLWRIEELSMERYRMDRGNRVRWVKELSNPAVGLIALYPLLDIVFSKFPELGNIGFLWIIGLFLSVCVAAGWSLWRLWMMARAEKRWLTPLTLVAWFCFIVVIALPDAFVCDENIMQVGCLFDSLIDPADSGYRSQCFIGYPRRSFLIQALPSLAFGWSSFALNLGASLLVLPGLALFAYGIRALTRTARESDLITALVLALLFQCVIFVRILIYHDQTTQPVAVTLCLIGLFAIAIVEKRRWALAIALGLLALSTSLYPPVLSVIGLAMVVKGWALVSRRLPSGSAMLTLIGAASVFLSFVQTLSYRRDLRLGVSELTGESSWDRIKQLASFLAFQRNGYPFATSLLHGICLVVLILGALGLLGRRAWVLCAWSIAVFVAAFFADGYYSVLTWEQMSGIHRAAPVFPVVLALTSELVGSWLGQRGARFIPRVVAITLGVLPGVVMLAQYEYPKRPPLSLDVFRAAEASLPVEARPRVKMFLRGDISHLIELPRHYRYLAPDTEFNFYYGTCLPSPKAPADALVLTAGDELCEGVDVSSERLEPIGSHEYLETTVQFYRVLPPA